MQPLISVIIPCYNGALFIEETLSSILIQSEKNIEVIIVDDGSTDNTQNIIKKNNDHRIRYYYHENKGVSFTRNKGLLYAKGEFVIFFDADDIMTADFLITRVTQLKKSGKNFICGDVNKLIKIGIDSFIYRGTSNNLIEEILFYKSEIITCPSNYLFKLDFLKINNLSFNENLSSTSDKYFLLECAKYETGFHSTNVSVLIYRILDTSMSNTFTKKLVQDNELFYSELIKNNLIPKSIFKESLARGYFILSGANKKTGNYFKSFYYIILLLKNNPIFLFKMILKKNF